MNKKDSITGTSPKNQKAPTPEVQFYSKIINDGHNKWKQAFWDKFKDQVLELDK